MGRVSAPRLSDPGDRFDWGRPARHALAVVFLADPGSPSSRDYLRALADARNRLAIWDGRPVAIVPPGTEPSAAGTLPFPVLLDEGGALRERFGLSGSGAAVAIVDRWGELYDITYADGAAGLPGVERIEGWLRYMATQCPECGVPDEAGPL